MQEVVEAGDTLQYLLAQADQVGVVLVMLATLQEHLVLQIPVVAGVGGLQVAGLEALVGLV